MTLPFHERLEGINCPNFNIVISSGIGKPEDRERNRIDQWVEEESELAHLSIKFVVLYGVICGTPKQLQ